MKASDGGGARTHPYRRGIGARHLVVRDPQHAGRQRTADRLAVADTASFPGTLARLAATIDRQPGEAEVLTFARQYRLSVYDAAYLELALELARHENVPLASLDRELVAAARSERVSLIREAAATGLVVRMSVVMSIVASLFSSHGGCPGAAQGSHAKKIAAVPPADATILSTKHMIATLFAEQAGGHRLGNRDV
jgi:predicted nucleic acid-binding protein